MSPLLMTLLLLLLLPPSSSSPRTVSPLEAVEHATVLFNAGETDDALALLHQVTELAPLLPEAHFYLGAIYQQQSDFFAAKTHYTTTTSLDPAYIDAYNNLGKLYSDHGFNDLAIESYEAALNKSPTHLQSRINLGLSFHTTGQYAAAIYQYTTALPHHPTSDELHYNLAVSYSHLGEVTNAVEHYRLAIQCRNDDTHTVVEYSEAWLNLAALHHKHGTLTDAVWHYNRTIDSLPWEAGRPDFDVASVYPDLAADDYLFEMLLMVFNNVGQALSGLGRVTDAFFYHTAATSLLEAKLAGIPPTDGIERVATIDNLMHTKAHLFRSSKMSCDWRSWLTFDALLHEVNTHQLGQNLQSALLPFDTLGLPVPPHWRKLVATTHAQYLSDFSDTVNPPRPRLDRAQGDRLKIGYICYDFNDHPTAHLAEGLFKFHNQSNAVNVDAYNYGKDDDSTYRRNIEALVGGRFLELGGEGHDRAAEIVRAAEPHVLIDMQGFTLGGRPEITARRIAPIQVNYLIFPGTSGASFIDYVVGDKWVSPPEHEGHFVEKVALLPNSYQINYYERHGVGSGFERGSDAWKEGRRAAGLKEDAFVFANFNKQDKLEPEIWEVWMQVLARVENSVLWLLEPSHRYKGSGVVDNLRREAAARGVARDRIVFAKRVDKGLHLARVGVADLFLDSFMYGAHSTATDALRGGLPMLTVGGDSFARRVGVSLVENLEGEGLKEMLLLSSMKELADVAVWLAGGGEGGQVMAWIRERLREEVTGGGGALFDTERYTKDFEQMAKVMWEVRECINPNRGGRNGMHIILGG